MRGGVEREWLQTHSCTQERKDISCKQIGYVTRRARGLGGQIGLGETPIYHVPKVTT